MSGGSENNFPTTTNNTSPEHLGSPKTTIPTITAVAAAVSTPSSPPSTELSFQANESIGQTSPPHNYRHSRAYRHFKNPPQPHMCIRVTTVAGEELFINVLSWTRIVIPQEPSDPIPLYGGMRVPPGSPRCPPLVYAVMANPEVLKDSGRHSKDPEERRAMVELMCDFVEAMNPDVKLTRNAVILRDRDISGELKDVWNAVQAQRDREREEEFARKHGLPSPDSIFYKGAVRELQERLQKQQQQQQQQQSQLHQTQNGNRAMNTTITTTTADNKLMYMEFGSENIQNFCKDVQMSENCPQLSIVGAQSAINTPIITGYDPSNQKAPTMAKLFESESKDITDSRTQITANQPVHQQQQHQNSVGNSLAQISSSQTGNLNNNAQTIVTQITSQAIVSTSKSTSPSVTTAITVTATSTTSTPSTTSVMTISSTTMATTTTTSTTTAPITTTTSTTTTITTPTTAPTKKEKLGGFLPNGCHSIFPRFKNHKNKDKDKDKEKEKEKDKEKDANKSSSHSKEKTLLNTFKKSTAAAANVLSNKSNQQAHDDSKTQFEKNCLNLNAEMEKLDINKLDSSDMLIKLKVASSGAK